MPNFDTAFAGINCFWLLYSMMCTMKTCITMWMANELQYIHWRLWGLCHYLCMRLCFTKERHRNNDVSKSSAKHQHIPCSSVKCQTMSIVIVYTHSHYKNTVWFVICPQEGTLRSTRAHIHPNSIFIHFFSITTLFFILFFLIMRINFRLCHGFFESIRKIFFSIDL